MLAILRRTLQVLLAVSFLLATVSQWVTVGSNFVVMGVDVAHPGVIVRLGHTSLRLTAVARTPTLDVAVSSVFSGADPGVAVAGTWGMIGNAGNVSFIGVRHWLVLSLLIVANIAIIPFAHRQKLMRKPPESGG